MPAKRQTTQAAPARRKKQAPAKAPSEAPPRKSRPAKPTEPKPATAKPSAPKSASAKSPSTARKPAPKAATPAPAGREPAVIVVGDHPAAHLAALLLHDAGTPVLLLDIGSTPPRHDGIGRLTTINPAVYRLHKSWADLPDRLELSPVRQVRFLGNEGEVSQTSDRGGEALLGHIADLSRFRDATRQIALDAGVPRLVGKIALDAVDERGVTIHVEQKRGGAASETLRPLLLLVVDPLPDEVARPLDVPVFAGADAGVQACCDVDGKAEPEDGRLPRGLLPMCLDLRGRLAWGWLLRNGTRRQLCVQHESGGDSWEYVRQWLHLLQKQGLVEEGCRAAQGSLHAVALPLGGALARDVVARRTLLAGPAGGFYAASGEDVYPGCWSAQFAAEVAARASKAPHPQDALASYRGKWGSTLGEYLRGPQQNLRFLLPLVYRNPVMTDRLADAILLGESLVK